MEVDGVKQSMQIGERENEEMTEQNEIIKNDFEDDRKEVNRLCYMRIL